MKGPRKHQAKVQAWGPTEVKAVAEMRQWGKMEAKERGKGTTTWPIGLPKPKPQAKLEKEEKEETAAAEKDKKRGREEGVPMASKPQEDRQDETEELLTNEERIQEAERIAKKYRKKYDKLKKAVETKEEEEKAKKRKAREEQDEFEEVKWKKGIIRSMCNCSMSKNDKSNVSTRTRWTY